VRRPFLLYLLAILGFVFITLVMNRYLGPKPVATALRLEPFECGATPVDARNPWDARCNAIVNYDDAAILPDVLHAYTRMVHGLMNKYYWGVTRYSTSSLLRAKPGKCAQESWRRAPHLRVGRGSARPGA